MCWAARSGLDKQWRHCALSPAAAAAAAECKQCYGYITSAGETCRIKAVDNVCWGAAKLGYCAMRDALVNGYAMNATTVGLYLEWYP
jgi:hypothetical protein